MLLPLEYSMTLWWVATAQWGTEPDSDFVAPAIEATDTLDPVVQDAAVPVKLAVPMRSFVTGYIWTAEPHWAAVHGPMCEAFETACHDTARRRNERARHLVEPPLPLADGARVTVRNG